jgi:hypothetical protein
MKLIEVSMVCFCGALAVGLMHCSSSSSSGTRGSGGMFGGGTGGTSGGGTGGTSGGGTTSGGSGGALTGVCAQAASYVAQCGVTGDFGACDSTSASDACIAACILAASCADILAMNSSGTPSTAFVTCLSACPTDTTTQWTCANGNQIDADYVCDGMDDCGDNSDEANCG